MKLTSKKQIMVDLAFEYIAIPIVWVIISVATLIIISCAIGVYTKLAIRCFKWGWSL